MFKNKGEKFYEQGMAAYEKGEFKDAVTFFERAREQGYLDASRMLGRIHNTWVSRLQDVEKARAYYKEAAENGCEQAYGPYAWVEEKRFHNYETARYWYGKAIEADADDNGDSVCRLANLYLEGKGVPRDLDRAEVLIYRAAKKHPDLWDSKFSEFLKKLEEARKAEAALEVAPLIAQGKTAFNSGDYNRAFSLFSEALENHSALEAAFLLSSLYEEGRGVTQDEWRALALLEQAAWGGYKPAIDICNERLEARRRHIFENETMSNIYKKSKELKNAGCDGETWIPYCEELARKGLFTAQLVCAEYYRDWNNEKKDDKKAHYWDEAAAGLCPRGFKVIRDAQYRCAVDYSAGRGTEKDEEKAYQWFLRAANNGDSLAMLECSDISERRGDIAKRFYWLNKAVEQIIVERGPTIRMVFFAKLCIDYVEAINQNNLEEFLGGDTRHVKPKNFYALKAIKWLRAATALPIDAIDTSTVEGMLKQRTAKLASRLRDLYEEFLYNQLE